MDPQLRTTTCCAEPPGPWKHGSIPVIGVIGAIGGGKSRVAGFLADRGALVLDADAIGHAVLRRRGVRDQLVARFGSEILERSGARAEAVSIDRRALGAIVFADPAARRDLEAIVHPRMRRIFERAIGLANRHGRARAVVLDAAILFEAGWNGLCDRVVYVDAPRGRRLERLAAQRGWTEATLRAREQAQWPPEVKRRLADAVLVNDADLVQLEASVDRLWDNLASNGSRRSTEGTMRPAGRS